MQSLTVKRSEPSDPILLDLLIFNPATEFGISTVGLFDTGNDHTAISQQVFADCELTNSGKTFEVSGVTGGSSGISAILSIGLRFDNGHQALVCNHEVVVIEGLSNEVLIGRDFLKHFDVKILRDGAFILNF